MNTAANSIQSRKLKYYCDITSSKRIYASDYVEDGIPFVRGKEVVQRYKNPGSLSSELFITRNKFETLRDKFGAPIEGDLLLTSVGTLGVPYYVKPEDEFYFKDGNLIWFRQFQELRSKFLYYWIQSPRGRAQLQKCTIGTSQSAYTIERLKEIELDDFALCKQERIASILSAYDDLIENNRRRIALLEQAARLLYKEWFVHLRFPGHEHVKIKNGVPEGWERTTVEDSASFISRGITPSYDDEAKGLVINQKCIRNHMVNLDLARHQSKQAPPDKLVRCGDVLVNSTGTGTLGRVAQFLFDIEDCTVDSHITIIRPAPGVSACCLGSYFVEMESYIESMGRGATNQTELARATLAEMKILNPTKVLADQYDECLRPMQQQMVNILRQNEQLVQARDLLLPRLMNGEVAV